MSLKRLKLSHSMLKKYRLLIFSKSSPSPNKQTFTIGQKGVLIMRKVLIMRGRILYEICRVTNCPLLVPSIFFLKKRTICPLLVRIIVEHVEIVYFCQSTGPKSHCELVLYWRKWVVGANLCRAGLVL